MKASARRVWLAVGAAWVVGLAAGPASAVRVFDLDTESYVVPSWFVYSGTPSGGVVVTQDGGDATNFEIQLGVPNFGASSDDSQTSALYAAGAFLADNDGAGYRIEFETDLWTWDYYTDDEEEGSSYWDVFAVNVNQFDYYWDFVDGGAGPYMDPIVGPDPLGACVATAGGGGDPCTAATGSILPGETWAFGGTPDEFDLLPDSDSGSYTLTLVGAAGDDYYLSVVLDTATWPDADTDLSSWGAFNPLSEVPAPTVPEPGPLALLGTGLAAPLLARRRR